MQKTIAILLLTLGGLTAAYLADPGPSPHEGTPQEQPSIIVPSPDPAARLDAAGSHRVSIVDPIEELWTRLRSGHLGDADQVATGRFLREYDENLTVLESADLSRAQAIVRTPHWVRAEVPFDRGSTEQWARVRLIEEDGIWKIEDLRVIRSEEPHGG